MNRAFLDVDTQIDFLFPAGALYVRGAESLVPLIARLNRFAIDRGIALISTACAHEEDDLEFREWLPHCVKGTVGQQKPTTLLVGQRIFEKQHTDLFLMPETESLISGADEYVVYGVVTEVCVKAAAFGLLARGKKVTVLSDAVKAVNIEREQEFFKELLGRGGRLAESSEFLHAG